MANAVYCVTDKLLKNNYYYALSTASVHNSTLLPSSHTGITDSGASGFNFVPGAHVLNINTKAPAIEVEVANGLPVRSIASATLASMPSLPPATMLGHVMPSFPHSLVGLGPFADQGCKIVFTKDDVDAIDPTGICILKRWRECNGARLWRFPLMLSPSNLTPSNNTQEALGDLRTPAAVSPTNLTNGIDAVDDANQACSVSLWYGRHQALAFAAQSTKPIFDPRSLDLPSAGALVGWLASIMLA
jgi:hypothetical protein